jgi:hypothetical protein
MEYMSACDGNSTKRVVKLIESSLEKWSKYSKFQLISC